MPTQTAFRNSTTTLKHHFKSCSCHTSWQEHAVNSMSFLCVFCQHCDKQKERETREASPLKIWRCTTFT